jgi:hypothetical protein
LTAIIEREDEAFVAPCLELDIASEGKSIEEASELGRGFLPSVMRQSSNHAEADWGDNVTVPVPLHDPVRRGTLLSTIRQSGVTRALFETGE